MRALMKNCSVRTKLTLVTMIVTTTTLLLVTAVFVARDIAALRREVLEGTATSADIVGNNCTAALTFNTPNDASEVLSSLRADANVDAGWIFTPDMRLFASYTRVPGTLPPTVAQVRANEPVFADNYLL